jgi:hypothetical protein
MEKVMIDGKEMVYTPHTKQLVDYKGRWKNPVFTKEYFRIKQRRNLREPYINENGEKRGKKQYVKIKTEKEICWLCNRELYKNFMNVHMKSKDHLERYQMLLDSGLDI